MNEPISHGAIAVAPAITSLASTIPVPGLGALHTNAFLLEAEAPVLIDTGVAALAQATVTALASVLDPRELRFIWLTHGDPDHVGALDPLLELAPHARIVTNYLGMGKLMMHASISPERFLLINPGQSLHAGDRKLTAVALPSYDAPETMGVFDSKARALFSSDCFGALLSKEDALGSIVSSDVLDSRRLRDGLVTWATVDAPWLHVADPARFRASLRELANLSPELVLGAHLAPSRGRLAMLLDALDAARAAPRFVGPDQAALEAVLAA